MKVEIGFAFRAADVRRVLRQVGAIGCVAADGNPPLGTECAAHPRGRPPHHRGEVVGGGTLMDRVLAPALVDPLAVMPLLVPQLDRIDRRRGQLTRIQVLGLWRRQVVRRRVRSQVGHVLDEARRDSSDGFVPHERGGAMDAPVNVGLLKKCFTLSVSAMR